MISIPARRPRTAPHGTPFSHIASQLNKRKCNRYTSSTLWGDGFYLMRLLRTLSESTRSVAVAAMGEWHYETLLSKARWRAFLSHRDRLPFFALRILFALPSTLLVFPTAICDLLPHQKTLLTQALPVLPITAHSV